MEKGEAGEDGAAAVDEGALDDGTVSEA